MAFLSFFFIICSFAQDPSWTEDPRWKKWEAEALKEVSIQAKKDPSKEYLIYLAAAREFFGFDARSKAREYYLKAWEHPEKADKTEVVLQLVALDLENKPRLKDSVARAESWFKENPKKLLPEWEDWLALVKSHAEGKTKVKTSGPYALWSLDSRVDELIADGKAKEAYALLGAQDLKTADINRKVRHDLLSALVLGKKEAPPLWCKETLDRYPGSLTWSMRICRYLSEHREGKKKSETIATVRAQLEKESPERLPWVKLLEGL